MGAELIVSSFPSPVIPVMQVPSLVQGDSVFLAVPPWPRGLLSPDTAHKARSLRHRNVRRLPPSLAH